MYFYMYLLLLIEMSYRLGAVMYAKFLIQVGDMPFQGPLGDDQLLCHFLVG